MLLAIVNVTIAKSIYESPVIVVGEKGLEPLTPSV